MNATLQGVIQLPAGEREVECGLFSSHDGCQAFMAWMDDLRCLRRKLNCSHRSAWFRGHEDCKFKLQPALYRTLGGKRPDLRQRLQQLHSQDRAARHELQELERKKATFEELARTAPSEREKAKSLNLAQGVTQTMETQRRKRCEYRLREKIWFELGHGDVDIHAGILEVDLGQEERRMKGQPPCLENAKTRDGWLALGNGERDAYHTWRCRAGRNYGSSWEMLCEMQHYGVATRLLDWTENLSIALYFALKFIRPTLDGIVKNLEAKGRTKEIDQDLLIVPAQYKSADGIKDVPIPEVWVLNPYKLAQSEKGWGLLALLDPWSDHETDYARAFLERRDWRFRQPMPFTPRWNDARLAAQMGLFTVFGLDRRALEDQLGGPTNRKDKEKEPFRIYGTRQEDFLGRIQIPPLAAVYALRHLREFTGQSDYSVFRDHDKLGSHIQEHFIDPVRKFR